MGVTQVSDEPRAPERLLNRLWEIARRPFILTILLMAAIIHLAALFGRLPERATQTDFSVYYSSALVLRHGGNPYVTDLTQVARRLGLDVVLALAAKARLCSERAIWAMLASYLLLKVPNDLIEIARRHHRPVLFFGIGEIYFVTLILAYMSAYWLNVDYSALAAADGIPEPMMNQSWFAPGRRPSLRRSEREFVAPCLF